MQQQHLADVQDIPTIGIITALPKEYVAVEVLLEHAREIMLPGEGANRRYMLGDVPLQYGGKQTVVLALLPIMGIAMAATRATRLLEHFPRVREIIMVGIAGGIPYPEKPDEHVRLGDIVVSDQYGSVQYDFVKRTTNTVSYRSLPRPPSANLLLAAKHLEVSGMKGERPWMPFIERAATRLGIARPSEAMDVLFSSVAPYEPLLHPEDKKRIVGGPRVFLGPIASANTLLKDPVLRDELRDRFNVKAVEMEGAGIADATWELGAGYLVIRGICDYCDSYKGDDWQEYAAIVAAGYTRALLESLPATSPNPYKPTSSLNVPAHPFSSPVGPMRGPFMVEDLPADFVPRPHEFHTLREMLVDSKRKGAVAITAALRGAGGYGKTTMAKALCHDIRVQELFRDGILWVTLGEKPGNLVGKIEDLIYTLSKERPGFASIDAATSYLAALLADRTLLLVIDDVWNNAHLTPFLQGGKHCTRLITTRDDSVLPIQTQRIQVDAMQREEATELLSKGLSDIPRSLRDTQALRTLAKKLGEWPLLLKLVNGVLRERLHEYHQPLSEALIHVNKALKKLGLTAFDSSNVQKRDQAVKATLQVSFELLNGDDFTRYCELAVFPEDTRIPLVTVQKLWSLTSENELDDIDIDVFCGRLRRLSLLLDFDPVKHHLRLHDVIRAYLQQELGTERLVTLHGQLLDSHHMQHWAELPDNEPYLWDHLASHLIDALRSQELVKTVLDFYYIAKKAFVRNTYATVLDVLAAETQVSDTTSLRLLKHNITNMGHLLNACHTLDEAAVTLHSRLVHLDELTASCQVLRKKLSRPFLMPWHMLPSLPDPALIRTLQGHERTVEGCAISPDSTWIVSASSDNTLKVWDAQTGAELLTLSGHQGNVYSCAISPLGDYIVSASGDNTLKVWDAQIGAELLTLRGHTGPVRGCAVSPKGDYIVSASEDKTLKIWDAQTGIERLTLQGHEGIVRGCAVSPGGDWIVSASWDKTVKVWDVRTGRERLTLTGHAGAVYACAISPSEDWIVSASWDKTLKVWDVRTGRERRTLKGHKEIVFGCAVSPKGEYIVSAGQDENIKVWDAQTGAELSNLEGHTGAINACAVSPKGDYIVSAGQDEQLKMWDMHATSKRLVGYWHKVNGCAASPDGKWIVSAQEDEKLKVWDTQTGAELLTLEGHAGPVYACAISPQGDWIVSASDDNTLSVWDARTGEELGALQGHTERVYSCAISPQGNWIVSASDDKTLIVWDRETGYDYLHLYGHKDVVNGCAISPQGDWIVSASGDKALKLWDTRTGSELRTLTGHTAWVHACAVSPQGDWIVSASADKTLKIWDVQSGIERKTLQGHADSVSACAINPDGSHIVSVAHDGTVKIWNTSTGDCLTTLVTEGALRTCAFCPDGEHIIAGGYSGLYFLQLVLT